MLMALYCCSRFSPKVTNRALSACTRDDHALALMSCCSASSLSHGPYQLLA